MDLHIFWQEKSIYWISLLFGHHPYLIDQEGKGFSKRLGSLTIQQLKDRGFENITLLNYLLSIGTSKNLSNEKNIYERNNQIDYVCAKLKSNKNTRHAAISIYDAKEYDKYKKDTPCTYAVQFTILNNKLNMAVVMRSNDLWYGFCNDQYCFSRLQELVSERTGYEVGTYYHFAHNLHLYNNKITN